MTGYASCAGNRVRPKQVAHSTHTKPEGSGKQSSLSDSTNWRTREARCKQNLRDWIRLGTDASRRGRVGAGLTQGAESISQDEVLIGLLAEKRWTTALGRAVIQEATNTTSYRITPQVPNGPGCTLAGASDESDKIR